MQHVEVRYLTSTRSSVIVAYQCDPLEDFEA